MMKMVRKTLIRQNKEKKELSIGDKDTLELLENGGIRVNADNLKDVISEIRKWKTFLSY